MPKVVRTMREQDGMPAVGTAFGMLGVRVNKDINPDEKGMVYPDTGGLSVARSIRDLPGQLVPKRLRHLFPGATGKDTLFVWAMGDGDFADGDVADSLRLRRKPYASDDQVLGLLEPDATMLIDEYQTALAATQQSWSIDEPT